MRFREADLSKLDYFAIHPACARTAFRCLFPAYCEYCQKQLTPMQVAKERRFCSKDCSLLGAFLVAGKTTRFSREYFEQNPDEKFRIKNWLSQHPEFRVIGGKAGGLSNVLSGRLFEYSKRVGNIRILHDNTVHGVHEHRSNPEYELCKLLYFVFGEQSVVANHPVGRRELDFIVLYRNGSIDNMNSWRYVIEYHPYDRKRTLEAYYQERLIYIRLALGIKCRIIIYTEKCINIFKMFDNENWCEEVWGKESDPVFDLIDRGDTDGAVPLLEKMRS